jgi:peptidyl-prolyl cis-trans isomerase C
MHSITSAVRKWIREPLLHFLVIGAGLFAVYGFLHGPVEPPRNDRIVVAAADVERLASVFGKTRMRPPTAEETEHLIAEFVREEVLYREALALGLDRDDVAIRRLLRQKFEFLTQDLAVEREPERAKLVAWYEAHTERYREPARITFTQVYFDIDRRRGDGERQATVALASLRNGTGISDALGDGQLLDTVYEDKTEQDVAAMFGPDFAAAVLQLQPGLWSGPIRSGYGIHLVRLDARSPGRERSFEAVADQVQNDWAYAERHAANEEIYRRLLDRYEVVVEPSATSSGDEGARP